VYDEDDPMLSPDTNLHYATNANFPTGVGYDPQLRLLGFNLADVNAPEQEASLTGNTKGLWFETPAGVTPQFMADVAQAASDPHAFGFYLGDDVLDEQLGNVKAMADYIHANAPNLMTFIVAENYGNDASPSIHATPASTDVDLIGVDPYPVRAGVMDLSVIAARVQATEAAGWSQDQLVPVYQAFGAYPTGNWSMPTWRQELAIMGEWARQVPNPTFDYTYSWGQQLGDQSLSSAPWSLKAVFAAHNYGVI
jgi:hypothetical protein